MSTVAAPADDVNVLHGVTWETYERLLADRGEDPRPLLTFDRGELEIMSPSKRHERLARHATVLVGILSLEWGLEVADLGSTTFRHPGWERGFEPDGCFYVGAAADHADRSEEYDPHRDPAPDVVVEIDISRRTLSKDALFAQFGIPELWRHDGSRAVILLLAAGKYRPAARSLAFPPLTADDLTALLTRRETTDSATWARAVQDWARAHAPTR
jgi:Uma2 family endonuclease